MAVLSNRNVIYIVVVLSCAWATPNALAYDIVLDGFGPTSNVISQAKSVSFTSVEETLYPRSLPYANTSTVSDGAATSSTQYDLSLAEFGFAFSHARVATVDYISWATSRGNIFFTTDEDIRYLASGSYTAVDATGAETVFRASLYDDTLDLYLFESLQESIATPNETFTLGLTGGDSLNVDDGSLSGVLLAGHDYRFEYRVAISAPSFTATSATATGNLSLGLSAIPEPGTAMLLGIGLVVLASRIGTRSI